MFKVGMKVKKILHGFGGYIEENERIVAKIENDVVYLDDGSGGYEYGVTYDINTGRELENFFLPMYSEIVTLGEEE